MPGVALDHLVGGLEASCGNLRHRQLLVISLLCGDDGGVSHQREVNSWIGHKIGLKLSEIHIELSVESKRGGDGGDDLADEPVEVGVGRPLYVQVTAADVVDGLVIDHEGAV